MFIPFCVWRNLFTILTDADLRERGLRKLAAATEVPQVTAAAAATSYWMRPTTKTSTTALNTKHTWE